MKRVLTLKKQFTIGRKNILIIGTGLMAETLVDYLLLREENHIIIASLFLQEAVALAQKNQRCWGTYLDMADQSRLDGLVKEVDVVVAYLPPQYIVEVANSCLRNGSHLVTSQYMFPELLAMHEQTQKKGLLFLNELGLDPGLDHLATIKVKEMVEKRGGKIIEYESWCGGLPAPDSVDNPFGYKFSWSPLAALKNINNDAVFLEDGKIKQIPASDLLYSRRTIKLNAALVMEGYANRDSVPYKELYGLDDCQTLIRGTLRYPGYCVIMSGLRSIGLGTDQPIPKEVPEDSSFFKYLEYLLKNENPNSSGVSEKFIRNLAEQVSMTTRQPNEIVNLLSRASNRLFQHRYYVNKSEAVREEDFSLVFQAMQFLQFFNEKEIIRTLRSHIENLAIAMQDKMGFKEGQTDFIAMQHIFRVKYPGENGLKTIKSTLLKSGDVGGRTAMAQTVSIPCGVGVQCILDGRITLRGVHMPNRKEICDPISEELEKWGMVCTETEY